jgi:hypothetical protein
MAEILVEDGATYPVSITVPEDGDARNAASVVVSFQALANRLAHFWTKFANALINGGTITLPALTFTAPISGSLTFGTNTALVVDRNLQGPLFGVASAGRANKKTQTSSPGTNQSINTITVDTFLWQPSAAIEAQIANNTYVRGDHFRVVNYTLGPGSETITVKNPAGTTLAVVPVHTAGQPGWGDFVFDGTNWLCTGHN